MNQNLHFFNRAGDKGVGAIAPTSLYAATTMVEECARHVGPKRVLELGAGTGAITDSILPYIGPEDELMLCEIHPEFVKFLRHRMQSEPAFRVLEGQISLEPISATELQGEGSYDYIICSIPFSIIPPEVVRAIFERCRVLLKPGGIMSYIEYAWLRGLRKSLLGPFYKKRWREVDAVLDHYISNYQLARRIVLRNLPPAWIRHLRFSQGPAERALQLAPLEKRHRFALGEWGISHDAVGFSAVLIWLASLMRSLPRVSPVLRVLPLLVAGLVSTFLRDPRRDVKLDPDIAYSSCDGRVLHVEMVSDSRLGEGEWLRIATFLGIEDVHINRTPVGGKIVDVFSRSGGHAVANMQAAERNNAVFTVIEGPHGRCVVVQRVGMLARRIVNWYKVGDLVAQGERYGLIRLGSRTDVYLPAGRVQVLVNPGQRVRGGVTPLARFH